MTVEFAPPVEFQDLSSPNFPASWVPRLVLGEEPYMEIESWSVYLAASIQTANVECTLCRKRG